MITPDTVPFYLNWTFWTAVVAFVALALSQLPPLQLLLRPRRLDVEVHSRINLTHKVGNPNAALQVSIGNSGGRQLQIRTLRLNLVRDDDRLVVLPAQNYFETPSSQTSVLFVPFTLKPGEHWSHVVSFLNYFDRKTEKLYRERESALREDIHGKLRALPKGENEMVRAEENLVQPFRDLFERLFIWEPGEYVAELVVEAAPGSATFKKPYRFTIFESDTADLRRQTDDYPYGGGIYFNNERHIGVFVPLTEHQG